MPRTPGPNLTHLLIYAEDYDPLAFRLDERKKPATPWVR